MLVLFGLDPDALGTNYGDTVIRRAIHRRFLDFWLQSGILIADKDFPDIVSAIERLPQDLRKRWETVLRMRKFRSGNPNWLPLNQLSTTTQIHHYCGKATLLALDEVRAMETGVPSDECSILLGNPPVELCRFDCVDQSKSLELAKKIASDPIRANQKVSLLWKERFLSLAKHADANVTIIDRYAGERHLLRRDGLSGLRRFLMGVDAGMTGRIVDVFTASIDRSATDILTSTQSLASNLRQGGISEIRIHIVPNADFSRIAHHRYVRFGSFVCSLDVGLEVFEGENVFRDCPFSMRQFDDTARDCESSLRSVSTTHKLK